MLKMCLFNLQSEWRTLTDPNRPSTLAVLKYHFGFRVKQLAVCSGHNVDLLILIRE